MRYILTLVGQYIRSSLIAQPTVKYIGTCSVLYNGVPEVILAKYDINPLSPYDALKHHLTSLKTDLIFLQPRVLERKFP